MPASTELFSTADASPFGRRQRRARGARIPVTVVTGFLGSGKTTLIRELLRAPRAPTPRSSSTNTARSASTTRCCGHRATRRCCSAMAACAARCAPICRRACARCSPTGRAARCRAFERVIIETSGLADPGPVLQTFASDRALGEEFHLQSLVTVVDALNGAGNLDRMPEARHQVALADRIVLSKTDRADAAGDRRATGASRRIQRGADHGRLARRDRPGFLLDEAPDLAARLAGASTTTTRTPIRTGSTALRCFSTRRCPGRCSSR